MSGDDIKKIRRKVEDRIRKDTAMLLKVAIFLDVVNLSEILGLSLGGIAPSPTGNTAQPE